ncbi:unnamed protein product [Mytilus coruscus]|uniref:Integrase core domain-containing protein n=1 Tax=Mytilus coruscus TaxID=42192 RepID=A0A6J8BKE0_MYTCO|nr:unnamed protein product [Mytilus coruscus]
MPGDIANTQELVRYYHDLRYTTKEKRGFFMLVHNMYFSISTIKRMKRRLNPRRRKISLQTVNNCILELRCQGIVNIGYRAMWRQLNIFRGIHVSQEVVRICMREIDREEVALRSQRRLIKRQYFCLGPNYLIHVDGYDKLKPYGIAIHGGIDGFSRKVLWLKAGPSNNDPRYIANFYINFIKENCRIPAIIRSDAGTENVIRFSDCSTTGPR